MATRSLKNIAAQRRCGTMQVHHSLLELYPSYRKCLNTLEHQCIERRRTAARERATSYRVEVVVHVLYNAAKENISTAQVKSQLTVLNRDFRATNPDRSKTPAVWKGLVSDAQVEFVLATKDPKGNASTGITRTRTTLTAFDIDDEQIKKSANGGKDAWPTDRYLNIWVCSIAGGVLGYAQFPGGPTWSDGVVILNTAFGTGGIAKAPFNKGRTTTHEVGHYFNLRHIWGDTEDCSGTDFVVDTPNAEGPNYGSPTYPKISCGNGPYGDMFMNYMDYVDDAAMFMFTKEQVQRMQVTLDGPRKKLWQGVARASARGNTRSS
ncbi:MAG: zinc metalloprotease [Casimicrobium sp.]